MKVTRIIDAQVGDALRHRDTLIIETPDPPTEASERARGYGPLNWVAPREWVPPRDEDSEPYAPHGAAVPLQTFVAKFFRDRMLYGPVTADMYAREFMQKWRAEP